MSYLLGQMERERCEEPNPHSGTTEVLIHTEYAFGRLAEACLKTRSGRVARFDKHQLDVLAEVIRENS